METALAVLAVAGRHRDADELQNLAPQVLAMNYKQLAASDQPPVAPKSGTYPQLHRSTRMKPNISPLFVLIAGLAAIGVAYYFILYRTL